MTALPERPDPEPLRHPLHHQDHPSFGEGRQGEVEPQELEAASRRQRIRSWRRVAHHDAAGGRLVFAPDGRRGSAIYAMALPE